MFSPETHVLVVDDMMTMRKLVSKSLKEIGFANFTEAKDGADAFEKLKAATPPVGMIVSDWNMPNSTGLDLLKRVRSSEQFKSLPFILVTAEAEKAQIIEAVQAGVSNYVVKPFTTDALKAKIEAVYKKVTGS
ncbi:response regulator [bacterium]|nr:response regulator [bacterium]